MYIIKKIAENELILMGNDREDDFLRFIPSNYNTTSANLEIYLLPDHCCLGMINQRNQFDPRVDGADIVLDEKEVDYTDPANPIVGAVVATYPTQLVAWPYDGQGVFTAPAQFIPA